MLGTAVRFAIVTATAFGSLLVFTPKAWAQG
jgi:hypothetical protein